MGSTLFQTSAFDELRWCGVQTYCHTVISPGICPFCLSNGQMSASRRLRAWTRNYLFMEHVDSHIVHRT